MALPSQWANTLFGSSFRPKSPQGDGNYTANGMQQIGQMGSGQPVQWRKPMPSPQGGQGAMPAQGGAQTFSQMQNSGLARPSPQMVGAYQPSQAQTQSSQALQQKIAEGLATPSRYDADTFKQIRDAATNQLNTQFGAQRKEIDETLAKRGLLASSYAGGYYGDLAGQQANALGSLNADLLKDAAQTQAQDRSTAWNAAQNYQNSLQSNELAGYNANLSAAQANNQARIAQGQLGISQQQQDLNRQLGYGNLDLQAGQLTGQFGGNATLAARQQAQDYALKAGELTGNFNGQSTLGAQQQALAQLLGLGNLDVARQQAQTQQAGTMGNLQLGQQELAQKGQQFTASQQAQIDQFNRQLELQRADLTAKYGAAEADRQIEAQKVANQNAQFQQAQAQQASQFQQGQMQNQQQFTAQQELQRLLGLGNLDIQGRQLAQEGQQFQQNYALNQRAQDIDAAYKNGQLSLAQRNQALAELQNSQTQALEQQKLAQTGSQFNQSLQEQIAARMQSGQQFQQNFGLDQQKMMLEQMVQTGQLSIAQANQRLAELQNQQGNALEQQKLAQQGQQFQQSQFQQNQQFNAQQDLQKLLGLGNLDLQRSQLAQENQQFGQNLALQQKAQDIDAAYKNGQLSLAQRNQALQELQNSQQFGLESQKVANQASQFGQTLQEQIANRLQQNSQFGIAQQLQNQQFNAGQTNQMAQSQQALMAQLAGILGQKDYNATGGAPAVVEALLRILGGGNGTATSPYSDAVVNGFGWRN